ncbi:MAG: transaldolase family protein [Caldisericia bacterium]
MEIFLDSANLKEIEKYFDLGLINGITTNPSILSKEDVNLIDVINLCKRLNLNIFIQTIEEDYIKIFDESKSYYKLYPEKTILKIPFSNEGLKSLKLFKKENIPFSITAIFSLSQIILSLPYKPLYIIPYINRIGRYGGEPLKIIKDAKNIIKENNLNIKILSASFRSSKEIEEAFSFGSDAATIPPNIFEEILTNPLSKKAIEDFKRDYFKNKI